MRYSYDLHIHSALSPCAEEEMTPNNIVNMAAVRGIDIIAVTDHNTAGNVEAISKCAENSSVVFVPGIEVESAEEVHIICLFPDTESAMAMNRKIRNHLIPEENNEAVFGKQYIFDEKDNIIGHEKQMLLFAADMTAEEVFGAAERLGGGCYFAHADRASYSVFSALGTLPDTIGSQIIELSDNEFGRAFSREKKELNEKTILYSSDAHRLADMSTGNNFIDLPVEKSMLRAENVIKWIRQRMKRT